MSLSYLNYKNCKNDWISLIPSHWVEGPLKLSFKSVKNGSTETQVDKDSTTVAISRIETISTGKIDMERVGYVNLSSSLGGYLLKENDILFSHINSLSMIGNIAQYDGVSPLYHGMNLLRITPSDKVSSKYLFWLLKSKYMRNRIESVAKPAINQASVGIERLKELPCIYPPIAEQYRIADYLDIESQRIEQLISEKQNFITLLKEKRQALISHYVTKGLDPNVKMKDSGVEWIGEMPEHWVICRFKQVLAAPMMYGANEAAEDDNPENPRFIRITDMNDNGSLKSHTFKSLAPNIAQPYLLKDKDILLARSGATVGKSFIYRNEFGSSCFAGYLIKAQPDLNITDPDFIYMYTNSKPYWEYVKGSQIQATIQNVSAEKYGNLRIPIPSLSEQRDIVSALNRNLERIDAIQSEVERSIELLKEHRTALITAAVTGKIDVRDMAINNKDVS